MSEWLSMSIAAVATSVVGGPFGSSLGRKDYVEEGVPVIRGSQLSLHGGFRLDDVVFVTDEKADRHSGNLAFPGDVIVTQRGTLGQVGVIPVDCEYPRLLLSQSQMKITVDPEVADPHFLYYSLIAPLNRQRLVDHAISAGVPHINLATLREFELQFPPLEVQRANTAILRAIDDLVENNRRRIALLERMAQAIYREWFVHFRYPGHEDDELVDSSLGPVPAGWDVAAISDVVETLGGGTPSKKEPSYWDDGTITWFTPSDLTKTRSMFISSSDARITSDGLARSSARLFPPRSVLMTSRATLGVISISAVEGSTNQGFIVCVPNETLSEYHLYFWMLENVREFETLATGATFKEITRGAFRKFPIAVPPSGIGREFDKSVSPMAVTIERLLGMNSSLGRLRDMLLPKLVTGAIDVSQLDLDALIEEPAA